MRDASARSTPCAVTLWAARHRSPVGYRRRRLGRAKAGLKHSIVDTSCRDTVGGLAPRTATHRPSESPTRFGPGVSRKPQTCRRQRSKGAQVATPAAPVALSLESAGCQQCRFAACIQADTSGTSAQFASSVFCITKLFVPSRNKRVNAPGQLTAAGRPPRDKGGSDRVMPLSKVRRYSED